MKKLSILFTAVCNILLVACSSNTPTKTVEKVLNALENGDFETYARSFYIEDKSNPQKVEDDIKDLTRMIERNNAEKDENEKIKSYEILKEEQSKTGKYVRVSFTTKNNDDKENEGEFYLTKDDDGSWKILMFGSEKLMEE